MATTDLVAAMGNVCGVNGPRQARAACSVARGEGGTVQRQASVSLATDEKQGAGRWREKELEVCITQRHRDPESPTTPIPVAA